MNNGRKGFTLIELIVGIAIMAILSSLVFVNTKPSEQTVKREAERVAEYMMRMTQKSDRINMALNIQVTNKNTIDFSWVNFKKDTDTGQAVAKESLNITKGLECIPHFYSKNLQNTNYNEIVTYRWRFFPNGIKIFATASLPFDNSDKAGHKYLEIVDKSNPDNKYYVVMTSVDREP